MAAVRCFTSYMFVNSVKQLTKLKLTPDNQSFKNPSIVLDQTKSCAHFKLIVL